jgi:hypothetical protein
MPIDSTKNPAAQIEHRNSESNLSNEVIRDKALTVDAVLGVLGRPKQMDISSEGIFVPLQNGPAALYPGIDVAYDFVMPVRHILMQNNTNYSVYFEFDMPVKPGSLQLAPGAILRADMHIHTMHLMCLTAINVNYTEGACLVLRGER